MKTLLMIESWCFASGILLPRKIQEMGHRFLLVTRDPEFYRKYAPSGGEHPVLELADEIVVCDTNSLSDLLRACEDVRSRRPVDGVITSCDYYIEAAAEAASALSLPSNPVESVSRSVNKYFMRRTHASKGVPSPRFALALSPDDSEAIAAVTGLPAIVKPADMNGSALVRKVETVEAMKEAVSSVLSLRENTRGRERFRGALVEEFLRGEEFSAECCVVGGEVHILGVTDKQLGGKSGVVETGHMFPARMAQDEERSVRECVASALEAVGYVHGVAHVEVRATPEGPRIIEINPRIGGNYISELVERTIGVSPLSQMIQLALGEEPELVGKERERPKSAAVAFVLPGQTGILSGWSGEHEMATSPGVVRYVLSPEGSRATGSDDNDCYLGYVVAEDMEGPNAAQAASSALSKLEPIIKPEM